MTGHAEAIRVLHVDDELEFAELAATFLQRADDRIRVATAERAGEGLEYLRSNDVDCVVSDHDMPGRNGLEFLEAVRERDPDLPFILFTGKGSEEIASDAISAGVTDYLQKETHTDQYTLLANRIVNGVEQTRSRRAVARSGERLREVVDALPGLVYVVDEDGRYLLVNQPLAEFHGTTVEAMEGRYVDDVLEEGHAESFRADLETVVETGESLEITDLEMTDATGETHVIAARMRPFEHGETAARSVLGVLEDVTERKASQRVLQRHRAITRAATNTIITIDEDQTVRSVNPAVEGMFGYEPEELIGRDVTVLMDEAAAERHRSAFEHYLETGERSIDWTAAEFEARHRDGSAVPVSVSLGEGRFEGERFFVADLRDLSDRVAVEDELRLERDLLTGIVETSPVGIAVVDGDGSISFANERAEEIYGRSREEINEFSYDDPRLDVVDADGEPFADGENPFERLVAGEEQLSEVRVGIRRPGGERVWASVSGAAQWTDDGEFERAVFAFEDVTERRQLETELEGILARVTDAFFALDDEWRFTYLNERAHELINPEDRTLVGENVWEEFPEAVGRAFERQYRHAMAEQETVSFEEFYPAPLDAWFEVRAYPSETGLSVYFRDVTDRKEREIRLEETTARLGALYENSPDMIDLLDPAGTIVDANTRFCAELGYEPDEVVGRPIWEIDRLVGPEDVAERLEAVATGERLRFEGRYERRDGSTFPVEVHVIRLDLDGEDRFMAISRDITERQTYVQQITALHETAEEILRAETRQTVADVVVDAVEDILGMPINGVCFHHPLEGVLRAVALTETAETLIDGWPTFRAGESLVWDVFESGETASYDDVSTVAGRHNPETAIRGQILAPLGDHGAILVGSTEVGAFDEVDVSLVEILATHAETALDRIERESVLEDSEARYRSLTDDVLDTSSVGTFILNDDFEVVWISQATETYFGLDREAVVGADKRGLIEGRIKHVVADPEAFAGTVLATYDDNTYVEEFECHVLPGEDREERWLQHWSQPIETGIYAGGRIEHYTDITARVRRERQLRAQNDRLEEFASIVSHDLRNPLSVATGRIELAREDRDSEDLEAAADALDRSMALIEDLLTLAREGETIDDTEAVDLGDLAAGCWENVSTGHSRLRVETDRTIRADRSRLQQALENLFRNAVEHGSTSPRSDTHEDAVEHDSTSPGSQTRQDAVEHAADELTVTVGELPDGFYVEDDGTGFDDASGEGVFDVGYSTAAAGSGLGLNIVEQIATAHGWTISAETGAAGGARFEITGVEFVAADGPGS